MKALLASLALVVVGGCVAGQDDNSVGSVEQESAASGVTPTLMSRGTLAPFHIKSRGDVDLEMKAKHPFDIITRKHDYAVGSYTGWHTHPGPVFITVTVGTITFYEADDPTCTPHVVHAGESFVDFGGGHNGRNESGAPAQDISVITAPVGGSFRIELDPPGNCPF